jgi:hypothetical protein
LGCHRCSAQRFKHSTISRPQTNFPGFQFHPNLESRIRLH